MRGIFEKLETARAESIPFGPLTREDFNFLSRPLSYPGVQKVARERGIDPSVSLSDFIKSLGTIEVDLTGARGADLDAPLGDKLSGFYDSVLTPKNRYPYPPRISMEPPREVFADDLDLGLGCIDGELEPPIFESGEGLPEIGRFKIFPEDVPREP